MNRWMSAGLAFVVGLSGSFAVVSASQDTRTPDSGTLLGPIDFAQHCADTQGNASVAVGDSSNAYNWSCASLENSIFTTTDISTPEQFDAICEQQYGRPAYANPWDVHLSTSWECFYGLRG